VVVRQFEFSHRIVFLAALLLETNKLRSSFIVRSVEKRDRLHWQALWQDSQTLRKVPDEVTEVTWQRFLDDVEPGTGGCHFGAAAPDFWTTG
jgi:hypothetical protein